MATYTREEYMGGPLTVVDEGIYFDGMPIMEAWERVYIENYMRRVLSEYRPASLLEVGFGLGYTSEVAQQFAGGVATHYIVEPHPAILELANAWAAGRAGVVIIPGFVEDVILPSSVDLIFDDRHDCTNYGDDWRARIAYAHCEVFHVLKMLGMTAQQFDEFVKPPGRRP